MAKDQEKSGFLRRNWMTFVLIVVLIVLAIVFFEMMLNKTSCLYERKKEKPQDQLRPKISQQFQNPNNGQFSLESVDGSLRVMAELS